MSLAAGGAERGCGRAFALGHLMGKNFEFCSCADWSPQIYHSEVALWASESSSVDSTRIFAGVLRTGK